MPFPKLSGKSAPVATVVSSDEKWQDARFGDAPEVVPGTGLELLPGEAPEAVYPTPDWSQLEEKDDGLDGATSPASKPWWKRRPVIILSVVAGLLIVGLAVGLGIGLTLNKNSSSSESTESSIPNDGNNGGGSESGTANENRTSDINSIGDGKGTPLPKVSCKGGLCQSILSLSIYKDDLFVVARTTKNRVTIRPVNNASWEDDFVDLGETPGTLISQPSSFSWKVNGTIPRLDVFAVSSPDFTAFRRHYSEAEEWAEWEAEGTDIGSSIAICGPYPHKMDVWSTSQSHLSIYHDWWFEKDEKDISKSASKKGNTTEFGKMSEGENGWREEDDLGEARSAPAAVCRASVIEADVFWYDRTQDRLLHSAWDQSKLKWSVNQRFDGKFIGTPTVFSFGDEEWDFFGVQADKKLYHLGWKAADGGYSKVKSLGGSIASTPTAVSLKDGMLDIFALGTNGNLQHIRFDGKDWATEWEDLGIEAHSAPSSMIHEKRVYITAVTKDGDLISLRRGADDTSAKWKDSLEKETLGKDLSLDYFTYDS